MKSADLLLQLEEKLAELARAVEPYANQKTSGARFDNQLFHTRSTRPGDYLAEIRHSLLMLKQSVDGHRSESVAWMAERMVLQIGALQRELATQALRRSEIRTVSESENMYEKLAKHQGYERRLRAMIVDRESQLALQETLSGQQNLQREIAALEGRLQRCLHALKRIERTIEKSEQ